MCYLCDDTCPELQLKIDDMICTILLVMCRYLNIVKTQAEGFFVPRGMKNRDLLSRALGDSNPIRSKVSM